VRIIYFGSPEYAVTTLDNLYKSGHNILAVVTQPDKKRRRGSELTPTPIKRRSKEIGVKVFDPKSINNDSDCQKQLKELSPDIFIVVAYGQILSKDVLDIPRYGSWNGHASLLPKYRGAAPIQWSILNGDKATGVSIMLMDEGMDTGPILLNESVNISINENFKQLSDKLSQLTAKLVLLLIEQIKNEIDLGINFDCKSLKLTNQNRLKGKISYARLLNREDNLIEWNLSALDIHRKIMGLYPNAYSFIGSKRIKITNSMIPDKSQETKNRNETNITNKRISKSPNSGQIINEHSLPGLLVMCNDIPLLITEATIEGKANISGRKLYQQINAINNMFLGSSNRFI